ncbi:MAG: hypothetical protein JWQ18_3165 [Conexibacter sp.]|jgi:hypothetical protein|nr:hypothetical protein [Conexibacter sp.]
MHVFRIRYARGVCEGDAVFVGGAADDPVFAVMLDALEAPAGIPVVDYARPLSSEQVENARSALDAIEPAHAGAAARLHMLFAG